MRVQDCFPGISEVNINSLAVEKSPLGNWNDTIAKGNHYKKQKLGLITWTMLHKHFQLHKICVSNMHYVNIPQIHV